MAIVPTYDLKERPVVGAGTAPTQYRDYSGLVPKADSLVSASAEGVAKVALKYQNQADDTRADDVYVQMQKKALELQDAYLKRKGEAALTPDEQGRGLADQNQEDLHGYFNQITEGLTPGAKTRAMRKVNPLLMGQYALSTAHVRSQFSAYSDQVDKSLVEAQMQVARQNYEDPMAIEINAQTAAGQLEKTAVRHGWDPVTLANAKLSAVDAVVASAVSGALDASKEDPAYAVMARGILESYKDKLSGGASAKLYKAVTTVQDSWRARKTPPAVSWRLTGSGSPFRGARRRGTRGLRPGRPLNISGRRLCRRNPAANSLRKTDARNSAVIQTALRRGIRATGLTVRLRSRSPPRWKRRRLLAYRSIKTG